MRLCINVDHIATLRNVRNSKEPDPVNYALLAEKAGASGIVCHLREDRRHIKDDDVERLRQNVTTKLDLEMAATEEMLHIAAQVKPDLVTLVPEKREELTTERGLNLLSMSQYLTDFVSTLHESNISVSAFVEPEKKTIALAKEIMFDLVELHTGNYANAPLGSMQQRAELEKIKLAARAGKHLGLTVVAGHGLDYQNAVLLSKVEGIEELSIGYGIIVRALHVGMSQAVNEMFQIIN